MHFKYFNNESNERFLTWYFKLHAVRIVMDGWEVVYKKKVSWYYTKM